MGTGHTGLAATVEAGHRVLPGIVDIRVEAWGPTRVECMEEAAQALVGPAIEGFRGCTQEVERQVAPGDDRRMLAEVLQVVLDVRRSVGQAAAVSLSPRSGGGLLVRVLARAGPRQPRAPRSVRPQWVSMGRTPRGWRCQAIVDR